MNYFGFPLKIRGNDILFLSFQAEGVKQTHASRTTLLDFQLSGI